MGVPQEGVCIAWEQRRGAPISTKDGKENNAWADLRRTRSVRPMGRSQAEAKDTAGEMGWVLRGW